LAGKALSLPLSLADELGAFAESGIPDQKSDCAMPTQPPLVQMPNALRKLQRNVSG
jgi:hypothetical protein